MRVLPTVLAGLLALAQFIKAGLLPEGQAAQEALEVARPHRLLVNVKGGISLTTYTGGGYIGEMTDLTTGYSAGLAGTVRLGGR